MSALQWVIIAIVAGAIEIFTSGFWFLWLGIAGLLVAAGVSIGWLASLQSQLLFFSIFTLLFIIFTRPLLLRVVKTNDTVSNVKALIGQHGVTTKEISPLEYGQVKVNGEIWTAVAEEDIQEGTRIVVTGISGVKLQVQSVSNDE